MKNITTFQSSVSALSSHSASHTDIALFAKFFHTLQLRPRSLPAIRLYLLIFPGQTADCIIFFLYLLRQTYPVYKILPTIVRAKSKFPKQLSTIFSGNLLKHFTYNGIITIQRESTHSKVDAPNLGQRMSLRTPPILLADRIGIFILAVFSYRERQATQQLSFQRTLEMLIFQ